MVDEVLGEDDPVTSPDEPSHHGDAPLDATQRACAIIRAFQADGRVRTPEAVGRLVYMMQRLIAAERGRPVLDSERDGTTTELLGSGMP